MHIEFWSIINNSTVDGAQKWADWLTVVGELLFIAASFVGLGGWLLRWQHKKDRAEEEEDRARVKEEVVYQMESFKEEFIEYFEKRLTDLTTGVDRTVKAVEKNGGSSMADAINRIEATLTTVIAEQESIKGLVGGTNKDGSKDGAR